MAKVISVVVVLVVLLVAVTLSAALIGLDRQSRDRAFGIYLTKDHSEVISGVDVVRYNATSHELTLTEACAARLKGMPLMGGFAVEIAGDVALSGLFVPPITSRSYPSDQVVISYPDFEMRYGTMKIQMGYPWDRPPSGVDPRDIPSLSQFFERMGKLVM